MISQTLPEIVWPESWGVNEGWPEHKKITRPITTEPRYWGSLDAILRRRVGSSVPERIVKLGGPIGPNLNRTMEVLHRAMQAHHQETGQRPVQKTSQEWRRWDDWLRLHHDSSLPQQCDAMGLPALKNLKRTEEILRVNVEAYVKTHGKSPNAATSPYWNNEDSWLRRKGSSLSAFCRKMGAPSNDTKRTVKRAKQEIKAYYKATGRRPHQRLNGEWRRWNQWLYKQGTFLAKLCDEAKIPRSSFDHRSQAA